MSRVLSRIDLNPFKTTCARAGAVKGSVQKLNLVAELIRGKKVDDALMQLGFSRKKAAKDMKSLLNSAIANAQNNNGFDIDKLYISEILVGKSFTLKRFHPRGRGRAAKVMKPFSNMTIFVTERGE
jgi:large subunit ribosomal protein L22